MDALPRRLSTASRAPLVIALDTGRSMAKWAGPARDAVRERLLSGGRGGRDVSVCALGDYRCHLLQATRFHGDGERLARALDGFHACGMDRSFEFAMFYYVSRCRFPAGGKGRFVMIGNGPFRDAVVAGHVRRWPGDSVRAHIHTSRVLARLLASFRVTFLYCRRDPWDTDADVWRGALGPAGVVELEDPADLTAACARWL